MVAKKVFRKAQQNTAKPMNRQIFFNASQIPDPNSGFLDFSPNPPKKINGVVTGQANTSQQSNRNRKMTKKQKGNQQSGGRQPPPYQRQNPNWNRNRVNMNPNNNRFLQKDMPPTRVFNAPNPRQNVVPNMGVNMMNMNNMGGRRMHAPGPNIMPPPPPFRNQPPLMTPMPPMGMPMPRVPMAPSLAPPPPYRRSGLRGQILPPIPPPMQPMPRNKMASRMQTRRSMHPIFNGPPGKDKLKKPNANIAKKAVKGRSTIKTLKNLVNQYPMDKPWVTEAIRAEHDKKVDIENRLKGNKDDELFAQFKTQRDKFVGIYESAREEYLKKEAAAVKAKKDAK